MIAILVAVAALQFALVGTLNREPVPESARLSALEYFEAVRESLPTTWPNELYTPDNVKRATLGEPYRYYDITENSIQQWVDSPDADPRRFAGQFRYYFPIIADDRILGVIKVWKNIRPDSGEPLLPEGRNWVAVGDAPASNKKVSVISETLSSHPNLSVSDLDRLDMVDFYGATLGIKCIVSDKQESSALSTAGESLNLVDAGNLWKQQAREYFDHLREYRRRVEEVKQE